MTFQRLASAILAAAVLVSGPVFAQQPAGVPGRWVLLMPANPADVRTSPIRLLIDRDDDGVSITTYAVGRDTTHGGQVFLGEFKTYYPYKRGFVVTNQRAEWIGQSLVTWTLNSRASVTYSVNDRGLLVVEHRASPAADPRTDVYVRDSDAR